MPKINVYKYTAEEIERHNAAYKRLLRMIESSAPDAVLFRRARREALAAGFPIDWPDRDGNTLLYMSVVHLPAARAGLPQILIDAGADVNTKNYKGRTPLGAACWKYVYKGGPEYLAAIDVLLAGRHLTGRQDTAGTRNALRESLNATTGRGCSVAGAQSGLNEDWRKSWHDSKRQARRDWLAVYIDAWAARGRAERAEEAAPAFDYAL